LHVKVVLNIKIDDKAVFSWWKRRLFEKVNI